MTTPDPLDQVLCALRGLRIPAVPSETQLHRLIAAALEGGGFLVRHEVRLAPRCRIDFVVGMVGIEVKKGRPPRGRLIEQAGRYLKSDQLSALILVVERHVDAPTTLMGKPVRVLGLNRLWGVALP